MIRTLLAATAALTAIAAGPAAAQRQRPSGEQQLAAAIGDRVAGDPVDCIDLHQIRNQRVIDRTAIVYEIGDTLYVNRPRSGADSLNRWDTQLVRPFTSRLCRIDVVTILDQSTRQQTGAVFLGDFVPYRRVRTD